MTPLFLKNSSKIRTIIMYYSYTRMYCFSHLSEAHSIIFEKIVKQCKWNELKEASFVGSIVGMRCLTNYDALTKECLSKLEKLSLHKIVLTNQWLYYIIFQ